MVLANFSNLSLRYFKTKKKVCLCAKILKFFKCNIFTCLRGLVVIISRILKNDCTYPAVRVIEI